MAVVFSRPAALPTSRACNSKFKRKPCECRGNIDPRGKEVVEQGLLNSMYRTQYNLGVFFDALRQRLNEGPIFPLRLHVVF